MAQLTNSMEVYENNTNEIKKKMGSMSGIFPQGIKELEKVTLNKK